MIVKWNSWESFEERRFAALVVDNITSNTRDLAIALELSYLNVSKAGCEIESNATLPVLGGYRVSFVFILLSSCIRVVTTGT